MTSFESFTAVVKVESLAEYVVNNLKSKDTPYRYYEYAMGRRFISNNTFSVILLRYSFYRYTDDLLTTMFIKEKCELQIDLNCILNCW